MLGEIKKIHKKIYNRIRVALDIYLTQFQKHAFNNLSLSLLSILFKLDPGLQYLKERKKDSNENFLLLKLQRIRS